MTGAHVGRGTRGYRRPDETIREEVRELLAHNLDLEASEIEVLVDAGEVTLSGTVDSRDAMWLARDLVESVSGVRQVHLRLKVAR